MRESRLQLPIYHKMRLCWKRNNRG